MQQRKNMFGRLPLRRGRKARGRMSAASRAQAIWRNPKKPRADGFRLIGLVTCLSVALGVTIALAPSGITGITSALFDESNVRADDLSGIAEIIDGDTIYIRGIYVRLQGIDAPESGQSCFAGDGSAYSCGEKAGIYLDDLTGLALVRCEGNKKDNYGRLLATCFVQDRNINAEMVRSGWAVAYRYYSQRYVGEERDAKSEKSGLWQGSFIMPWVWRKEQRVASLTPARDCNIKGNISGNGKIYHVPGGRWYDATGINESRGERWFCSEAEALAAGWRSARYD